MRRAAWLAPVLVLTACVGPARSFGSYDGKAGATAGDMRSVVETARAAVGLAATRRGFAPYLSEVIHYAEDDASAIQGAFDSIQPPDSASDRLRSELDELLSQALSTISELRIAVRRADFEAMPKIGAPLAGLADRLERFADAHPSGGR